MSFFCLEKSFLVGNDEFGMYRYFLVNWLRSGKFFLWVFYYFKGLLFFCKIGFLKNFMVFILVFVVFLFGECDFVICVLNKFYKLDFDVEFVDCVFWLIFVGVSFDNFCIIYSLFCCVVKLLWKVNFFMWGFNRVVIVKRCDFWKFVKRWCNWVFNFNIRGWFVLILDVKCFKDMVSGMIFEINMYCMVVIFVVVVLNGFKIVMVVFRLFILEDER